MKLYRVNGKLVRANPKCYRPDEAHITPIKMFAGSVGESSGRKRVVVWDGNTCRGIELSGGDAASLILSMASVVGDRSVLRSRAVKKMFDWWRT